MLQLAMNGDMHLAIVKDETIIHACMLKLYIYRCAAIAAAA